MKKKLLITSIIGTPIIVASAILPIGCSSNHSVNKLTLEKIQSDVQKQLQNWCADKTNISEDEIKVELAKIFNAYVNSNKLPSSWNKQYSLSDFNININQQENIVNITINSIIGIDDYTKISISLTLKTSGEINPIPPILPEPPPVPPVEQNNYQITFNNQDSFDYGNPDILVSDVNETILKTIVLNKKDNIFNIPNNIPQDFNWNDNIFINIISIDQNNSSLLFEIKLTNSNNNNQEIKKNINFSNWKEVQQNNIKYPTTLEELRNTDPNWLATQPKYDSRNFNIVKQYVENQEEYNLCWSFATASASEVSILKEGINPNYINGGIPQGNQEIIDINEINIDYISNIRTKDADLLKLNQDDLFSYPLNKGNQIDRTANALMQWNGISNNPNNDQSQNKYVTNGPFVLEGYEAIPKTIESIKKGVAKYGALSFDYRVPHNSNQWLYLLSGALGSGHASSIIGWDDTIPKERFVDYRDPNHKANIDGGWIVRNSWGNYAHSEGSGYFYLSYDSEFSNNIFGYDYANRSDYDNNYYWDAMPFGLISNIDTQEESKNNDVAAVFPSKKATYNKKEFLKAVNVTIKGKDTNLEVKVYKNLTNINKPDSGELVFNTTKHYENSGCYTIKLPFEIELDPASYFSIVVKVSNSTNDAYIALNNENSKNDLTFYKNTDGSWSNFLFPFNRAAKIKAFTVEKDIHGTSHNNDLKYANIELINSILRYDTPDKDIIPIVKLENQVLRKDIDYTIDIKKELFENVNDDSDDEIVGNGTCIIKGIGKYKGINKSARFQIKIGLIPKPIPDIFEFNEQTKKCILRVDNQTNYNQIKLPTNWKWTYPNQQININKESDNYIEYNGTDKKYFRCKMLNVIPIKK